MVDFCRDIRQLVENGEYEIAYDRIAKEMSKYPHMAYLHNLMGIVMEKMGDHSIAMKHFRAASDLDPTYHPATENISRFGNNKRMVHPAYEEADCKERSVEHFATCEIELFGGPARRMIRRF